MNKELCDEAVRSNVLSKALISTLPGEYELQ